MLQPRFCCLYACLPSLLLISPVWANELETIEVHGKQESSQQQHLDETFYEPFTHHKIDAEVLTEEMATDVKSALRDVPNVSVTDSGAFSKRVEIRGLSGDRITYLVDDVVIANQGMTHAGGGEINLLDMGNIESIDVIKGSPSVIYSPGATGGIVSVTTKSVVMENHLRGSVDVGYDSGYQQDKESVMVSGGYQGFGASVTASRTNAQDYKIKNQQKLDEIILRTNVLDERLGTENEITDLGYSSDSYGLRARYQINTQHSLTAQRTNYTAEDISFTHGAATDRVFHYDEFSREANQLGYYFETGSGSSATGTLYNQELIKDIHQGVAISRTLLKSVGFNLKGNLYLGEAIVRLGAEYVQDEAETNTFSEQNYYALYTSYEMSQGDHFTYTAGVRGNRWEVEQTLKPGQNLDIIGDLVGVSGKLDPQHENALTYAAGVIYSATENNNIAFNYSRTHRYPTLMERFAFDVFIGGGLALEAESADNIELGWKYNDGSWYGSASIFYSRFDNFIGTKETRKLVDEAGLLECIRQGKCSPTEGNYDDREADFFRTNVSYINIGELDNRGFELSLNKIIANDMEAGLSVAINHFSSPEFDFIVDSRPLEIKGYYKKHFSSLLASPWVKVKMRYVTNNPSVEQREGFDPFAVVSVYAGGEYKKLQFSIGIRNLFDQLYHEPYTALDGLKRSFLASIRYTLG